MSGAVGTEADGRTTAGTADQTDDTSPSDAQVAARRLRWWRELLYTAVTRAESVVRLYGSPDALRKAVETRARRASGLVRTATLGKPKR